MRPFKWFSFASVDACYAVRQSTQSSAVVCGWISVELGFCCNMLIPFVFQEANMSLKCRRHMSLARVWVQLIPTLKKPNCWELIAWTEANNLKMWPGGGLVILKILRLLYVIEVRWFSNLTRFLFSSILCRLLFKNEGDRKQVEKTDLFSFVKQFPGKRIFPSFLNFSPQN